jgi:hypothetical protein
MRRLLAVAVAIGLGGDALATTGLTWTWDAPRRYYIDADVSFPYALMLQEEDNAETQVASLVTRIDTTCAPYGKPSKTSVEVRCSLDHFSLSALPLTSYRGKTLQVLDKTTAMLAHGYMQIQFGFDGQIRSIDLEGMESRGINERVRNTQETMRLVMARAFAAFDLNLPANGDDGGQPWTDRGSMLVSLPSSSGSNANVPITVAVVRTADTLVTMSTRTLQNGSVQSGETFGVAGQEQAAATFEASVKGFANFDTGMHAIVARHYEVVETPTASSTNAISGAAYVQKITLTLIKPGDPDPQPGANEERTE